MDDEYITIYEKLTNLSGLIKRYQMLNQSNFGPFADSTRGQGRILAMFKIQPEIKIKDLSYLLGIRQQSLSELLNKLEKGGYIERKISNEDKRVVIINLTEKGKNVESPETSYHEFFDCLTSEELKQFEEYLDRIIVAFEKKLGDDSKEEKYSMADWMKEAKERMGNEQFEQLMSMRERAFGSCREEGKRPENIPGAERFSKGYNGPIPNRDGFSFFGKTEQKEEKGKKEE